MRKILSILILSCSLLPGIAGAQEDMYFDSVPEMFEVFNDFSVQDDTFEVVNTTDLHIRLSPIVFEGAEPDVIRAIDRQAALYAVFNSFVYTDIDKIAVTVVPKMYNTGQLLNKYNIMVIKTREEALADIRKYIKLEDFSELFLEDYEDEYTVKFRQLLHGTDSQKGLKTFFNFVTK